MHEAALAQAAIPTPTVVLGLLLKPLSLGHVLAFYREGLMQSGALKSLPPEQLTAAVFICSNSWAESQRMHFDWLMGLKMWLWKKRVHRMARRYAKAGLKYFEREATAFADYLTLGSLDFPVNEFQEPGHTPGRSPGCPFVLRLQQWLMATLRITDAEAWDHPFGLAKMRWACHWEMEGGLRINNDQEGGLEEYAEREDARRFAEQEAQCQA